MTGGGWRLGLWLVVGLLPLDAWTSGQYGTPTWPVPTHDGDPDMVATERYGNSAGASCVFPFTYLGVTYDTCVTFGDQGHLYRPWCATTSNYDTDGQWGYCVRRVLVKEPYPSSPYAERGEECAFPFDQMGKWYYGCRRSSPRPFCKNASGGRGYCTDKVLTTLGSTTSQGLECKLPESAAKYYHACTDDDIIGDHYYWCYTTDNMWGKCGSVNRGKKAYSSSVQNDDTATYDPGHLNDGVRTVYFMDLSCTMTKTEAQPWWAVDLGNIYWVDDIYFVNVGAAEATADYTRLANFVVDVGWYFTSDPAQFTTSGYTRCLTRTANIDEGDVSMTTSPPRLPCDQPVLGQFVVVQLLGYNTYFAACDIGVQGRFYGYTVGNMNPLRQTSQHQAVPTPYTASLQQDVSLLFNNAQAVEDDSLLLGWALYAQTTELIHLQIWRPMAGYGQYQLIHSQSFTAPSTGYHFVNMSAVETPVLLLGDIAGVSYTAVQPTNIHQCSCSYNDLDSLPQNVYSVFRLSGTFVNVGTNQTFSDSGICIDYFVEAIVLKYACKSYPCLNGGTCQEAPYMYPENLFQCTCKQGFSGIYCEQEDNECSSNPCLNGGTCLDKPTFFTCVCPVGWGGTQCETTAPTGVYTTYKPSTHDQTTVATSTWRDVITTSKLWGTISQATSTFPGHTTSSMSTILPDHSTSNIISTELSDQTTPSIMSTDERESTTSSRSSTGVLGYRAPIVMTTSGHITSGPAFSAVSGHVTSSTTPIVQPDTTVAASMSSAEQSIESTGTFSVESEATPDTSGRQSPSLAGTAPTNTYTTPARSMTQPSTPDTDMSTSASILISGGGNITSGPSSSSTRATKMAIHGMNPSVTTSKSHTGTAEPLSSDLTSLHGTELMSGQGSPYSANHLNTKSPNPETTAGSRSSRRPPRPPLVHPNMTGPRLVYQDPDKRLSAMLICVIGWMFVLIEAVVIMLSDIHECYIRRSVRPHSRASRLSKVALKMKGR